MGKSVPVHPNKNKKILQNLICSYGIESLYNLMPRVNDNRGPDQVRNSYHISLFIQLWFHNSSNKTNKIKTDNTNILPIQWTAWGDIVKTL